MKAYKKSKKNIPKIDQKESLNPNKIPKKIKGFVSMDK